MYLKIYTEQTAKLEERNMATGVLTVISGFRRDVSEICALLECYAAFSGSLVSTFRDNLSVPSSRVKS
jgi:hypothetical protein